MTLSRSIVILCLCSLLLPELAGQETEINEVQRTLNGSLWDPDESMAVDSAGAKLDIPNVFTPNGDQINDYFEVATDGITVYEFSVFTRTGTRIFHSLSPRIFWDGKSQNGDALKEGIYYYVIEEEGGTSPFEKAGFMHLFR